MNLQEMNRIPRVGSLELFPREARGVVIIQVPNNPVIFYRGCREILQMVLTDLEISEMMATLEAQGIPHRWVEHEVKLHRRTPVCGKCPLYHPGFNESCSLRWDQVPDTSGLEEYILACPDPVRP